MKSYREQLGQRCRLAAPPQRIVSLVPSQTELLFALGACSQVVGRTCFCIYPEAVKQIPVVGGTKDFKPEKIIALRPDLILLSSEPYPFKERQSARIVATLSVCSSHAGAGELLFLVWQHQASLQTKHVVPAEIS